MDVFVIVLAIGSMVLAVGGVKVFLDTRHIGYLVSSIITIVCALAAIALRSFWPLVASFCINQALGMAGLDPLWRRKRAERAAKRLLPSEH